jgi:hypothetical protein
MQATSETAQVDVLGTHRHPAWIADPEEYDDE